MVNRDVQASTPINQTLLHVLKSPWFWLNYAVTLAITMPVPLLTISVNGTLVRRVPVYESYLNVFQGGRSRWNFYVIGIHLGLCLMVSLFVWAALFRSRALAPQDPE